MKCGKGHDHESVAEVRACYGVGGGTATATLDYRPNRYAGVCVLCGNNVAAEEGRVDRRESGRGYDVSHLSGLCPAPVVPAGPDARDHADLPQRGRKPFPDVPAGHYATKSLTGNNDYDFWRVDRPEQGQWAGRTFVKRVIGGKPDSPVRGRTLFAALEAILAEGVDVCGTRYGTELGQCRKCNRHLTDETSRALGIGPDCRSQGA